MPEIARNKRVKLDYQILEEYEAGLKLTGPEVKSAKLGQVNMEGCYVTIDENSEAWIRNLKIAAYAKAGANQSGYHPDRPRKLLLSKAEIRQISSYAHAQGLTVVPLNLYSTRSLVKVKIAVVRGKKKYDKRQTIKEREYRRRLDTRVRG